MLVMCRPLTIWIHPTNVLVASDERRGLSGYFDLDQSLLFLLLAL
jgi:hypothetical protein